MITRRQFLSHSCSLGVAASTVGTTLLSLGAARNAAAQSAGDYRALVCILLAGGNDSYNMLVPSDASQYNAYAGIRADLALPQADLLPLSLSNTGPRSFGLHPGMSSLQQLVNTGDAAMVANVGTLLEAFDPVAVENGTARLPVGLFSHADQINQWQTAIADGRTSKGWGGRIGDLLQSSNLANGVSMNISLSGTNVFQSGDDVVGYAIESTGNGAANINGYGDAAGFGEYRTRVWDELLAVQQSQVFRREFSKRLRDAIDTEGVFSEAISQAPALATTFSPGPFSAALNQIARVISVRDLLGATRQTFFITVGGWDHHDEVLDNQAGMLPAIANGLAEFRNALVELGAFDNVTTFTISDFGRTLTSNGRGSDHGWGGHHVVMGGAVNGGQLYGDYPVLAANTPLDVGRGIYAPTTPTEAYFAELALWFGVSPGDLDVVLPNVRTFYTPESGTPPLGLLTG
ncbi:MAG: DUF1501 domain-containing protein [Pseudomonadota bacterium]